MSYATYEYYATEYLGNELDNEEFLRYAKRASAEIDYVTFGRLKEKTEIPNEVKDAVCAVAEQMKASNTAATVSSSGVASESNDGYSVSYREVSSASLRNEYQSKIRLYLANTGLLSRVAAHVERGGACCDHDHCSCHL